MSSALSLADAKLSAFNKIIDLCNADIPGKLDDLIDLFSEQALLKKAMSGDIQIVATPATLGSSAAAVQAAIGGAGAKFTRTVTVALKTAAGETHTWFNGTLPVSVACNTTGDGIVAIAGGATEVTLVNGVGTVTLEYTLTWAQGDTCTLTIGNSTTRLYPLANKTSVDTLAA